MTRPFRFGAVFSESTTATEWPQFARRLEGEGFSTLLAADHYANPMAAMPVLAVAAACTTTLRVGTYVNNNDFRAPALLAKEIATLDVISSGRVEMGLGAGWLKQEYDQAGLAFDPGPIRVDRFEEAIVVIKKLLAGGKVHHDGTYYQLDGLTGAPVPHQASIPLVIGGGGPRIMRIAAREADIVAFNPQSLPGGGLNPDSLAEAVFASRVERLNAAIVEAGRTDAEPERNILIFAIAGSADGVNPRLIRPELVDRSPFALIGDTDQIVDTLLERRERWGISYVACFATEADRLAPVVARLAGV